MLRKSKLLKTLLLKTEKDDEPAHSKELKEDDTKRLH